MKKSVNLYVTEESYKKARKYLKVSKMSISSYVDSLLIEFVKACENKDGSSIFDKEIGDVTLSEFQGWMRQMGKMI